MKPNRNLIDSLLFAIAATAVFSLVLGCGARGAELPQSTLDQLPQDMLAMASHDHGLTYAEAYKRALAEGKPLICWIGGGDALCVPCVKTLTPEAVHYIGDTFDGVADRGLVVYVPDAGQLWYAGTITHWITGDATYGHVPSLRRAIANWRSHRAVVRGGWSTFAMATPVRSALAAPPMSWQPFRGVMRGNCGPGGCR